VLGIFLVFGKKFAKQIEKENIKEGGGNFSLRDILSLDLYYSLEKKGIFFKIGCFQI